MRGLVRRHDQVILGRDVVATVARPSDVERLALDRASRHFDQLADHTHLHRVAQQRIIDYRAVDQGQRKVSHIDGKSYALGKVQTGLAFQIQDDLLNLIGSEESTKKDFRSDITEGKRTLMVVHALQNSPKRERLIEILSSKEKDPAVLAEAVDIMVESGSIEYARTYAENLTSIAKNRLVDLVEPSDSLKLLISMADWFVNRLK